MSSVSNNSSTASNSPFFNSQFPNAGTNNIRVVQAGANGSKIVSAGDTSNFVDPSTQNSATMDQNQFMQLLVTQLSNQDPMNPPSDDQFSAQLAQFSQLTSSQNMEKSMTSMQTDIENFLKSQTSGSNSSAGVAATSLIGKQVEVDAGTFQYDGYSPVGANMQVTNLQATGAKMVVEDSKGNVVFNQSISLPSDGSDTTQVTWQGRDNTGKQVTAGQYSIQIQDATGTEVGYAYTKGIVSSVNYGTSGDIQIGIGTSSYPFSSVKSVSTPSTSS